MSILSLIPLMVTVSGAYFLVRLRFFFLVRPKRCVKMALENLEGEGAFSSFTLALAGTLGIGNIVGVAVGISVGGAGAVFWLLVSSVFSAVIKYSEGAISVDLGDGKGMIGVIEKSFGIHSSFISKIYAFLILALAMVMGGALQSSSMGQCAHECFDLNPYVCAFIITAALFFSVVGNSEKIKKIINITIPATTIIYIFLCFATVFMNFNRLDDAIYSVFSSAFLPESVGGGVLSFLLSKKIKEGYLRAILSNEAGAGTSSIAHSQNPSENLASVGIMGMCEVLFDTVMLCGLTAAALLVSVEDFSLSSGVAIVLSGIGGVFGRVSEYLVFVCIFAFAFSTLICWYYYGRFTYRILFADRSSFVFSVLFFASVFFGATAEGDFLIYASDSVLFLLSVISLSALMKNSDRIVLLSENCGIIRTRRKCRVRQTEIRLKYNRED